MIFRGAVVQEFFTSKLLANNSAGMSPERLVSVYLPKAVQEAKDKTFPVLYCLAPWTNAGRNAFDWRPFKESLPERIERLIDDGMPPCIVVAPDLYTDFGGSQFIDSSYFGPHAKVLVEEIMPFIEAKFPVTAGAMHRGAFGRSSGGFGALRLAMDYPGSLGACACHSGDMGFDLLFGSDLATLPRHLARYDGDVAAFLSDIEGKHKLSSREIHVLMLLGCSGFYSPDTARSPGFALPIDLTSGRIDPAVWQQWQSQDPVVRIDTTHQALTSLEYLYLECGTQDQYNLLYGARQLSEKLHHYKIEHDYQEFDDNHSGTDYRYDISLPRMLKSLT